MARIRGGSERQRGQGLVETALVLPIMLMLVVSIAEVGFIFQNVQSLVYGSREGARVGSALARGDVALCAVPGATDPSGVDATLVGAVQRILQSPDSGIQLNKVQQIRIFESTDTGAEAGPVDVWTYLPNATDIDPGPGTEYIDFTLASQGWPACSRVNTGTPDSLGVTVVYSYDFVMPVGAFVNAVAGGAVQVTLRETTVMALNPTT